MSGTRARARATQIPMRPDPRSRINKILGKNPFGVASGSGRLLQPVVLHSGDVVHTRHVDHVYFPVDCVVSLVTLVDGHLPIECGVIGSEGMVGVSVALGVTTSSVEAVVLAPGTALRMHASAFQRELKGDAALQMRLHRYVDALLAQVTQTAACNAFHTVEARCARWLLVMRDRTLSNHFEVTHAFIAQMLGVRRVGVTVAAGNLQRRGLIAYSRGRIVILDRDRLAAAACGCYQVRPQSDAVRTQRKPR